MHTSLNSFVDDVVHVHYFGPNADDFKAKCGQIAADFANKMHADIAAMAEAVRASTSNIAGSLGGAPISIAVEARPFIVAPATKSDAEVTDVETVGLEAADAAGDPATSPRCARAWRRHLSALQATDWARLRQGGRRRARCPPYTTSAQANCDDRRDVDHDLHRQSAEERPRRRQASPASPTRRSRSRAPRQRPRPRRSRAHPDGQTVGRMELIVRAYSSEGGAADVVVDVEATHRVGDLAAALGRQLGGRARRARRSRCCAPARCSIPTAPSATSGIVSGDDVVVGPPYPVQRVPAIPVRAVTLDVLAGRDTGTSLILLQGTFSRRPRPGGQVALTDPTVSRHHLDVTVAADWSVTVTPREDVENAVTRNGERHRRADRRRAATTSSASAPPSSPSARSCGRPASATTSSARSSSSARRTARPSSPSARPRSSAGSRPGPSRAASRCSACSPRSAPA